MFRGDPKTLVIKLENGLFFFHGAAFLASSEYLLGVLKPDPDGGGALSLVRSPIEKLADCRKDGFIVRMFGVVCESGGGPGRRKEVW
jgi:hypothetical protein